MRLLKGVTRLVAASLILGVLGPVFAPTPANAFNYVAQEMWADGVGRAGDKVEVTIYSKIPSGVSSVPDQVSVGIFGFRTSNSIYGYSNANFTSSSFATADTPTAVTPGIARYEFSFPAPTVAGSYLLKYCVSVGSSPYTYSQVNSLIVTYDSYQTMGSDVGCKTKTIHVGGAPSSIFCANKSVSANPTNGDSRVSARNQITLFDANGFETLLSGSEEVAIDSISWASAGRPLIGHVNNSVTNPDFVEKLILNSSSGDSDGNMRFLLNDAPSRTSTWLAFLTSQSANRNFVAGNPNCTFSFSTNPLSKSGFSIQISSNSNPTFASGTDGQLYMWGTSTSSSSYGAPLVSVNQNKPYKLEFTPLKGSANGTTVRKIVSGNKYIISSDGRIYAHYLFSYDLPELLSATQGIQGGLQPLSIPSLNQIDVVDATLNLNYLLDAQGRIWVKSYVNLGTTIHFSQLDLSAIGSPIVKQIGQPNAAALIFLTSSGEVYSLGDNSLGVLGQGTSLSTASLGQVTFQSGETVTSLMVGPSFSLAIGSGGNAWAWGNNGQGKIGKDPTVIPSSNAPILLILPAGIRPLKWRVDFGRIAFIAEDQTTIYSTSTTGSWNSIPHINWFGSSISDSKIIDFTFGSSSWGADYPILVTSTNRIFYYSNGSAVANCQSTSGAVRSVGQFGPASTDDAIRYAGIFQVQANTTKTVGTSISALVGAPFTLQVAQLRTNCYNIDELEFSWDLTGSGSYGSPVTPTLGQTGYQTLSAVLNYSTSGRKTLSLKIRTPDGADYFLNFIVGVDPAVTPTVPLSDTSSAMVFSSQGSAMAIAQDGNVYVWGSNNYGQLSNPTSIYGSIRLPLKLDIPNNKRLLSAYLTSSASYLVDEDGKTWAAGYRWEINGTGGLYESLTRISFLSDRNIRDIQVGPIGLALQSSGQMISWSLSGNLAFVPSQIVSLSGISIKQFAFQYDGISGYRLLAIDTDKNLWRVPFSSSGVFGDAVKETSFSNVEKMAWNGSQVAITTASNQIWYSVNGSTAFGQVSGPSGVTPVDAMYSNVAGNGLLFLKDSTNQIWTASASQSGSSVIMSTWTKYAAQLNGQANASDEPIFQHRGSRYITFTSGNLLYTGNSWNDAAGRCRIYTSSDGGNRVFSTGQFGAPNITDTLSASPYIAIASQNQVNFSSGQFFAVNSGDTVIIRIQNPTSSCFSSSLQYSAKADLDGSGNFATNVPLSNEGNGNYAFTFSAVAPGSGIKNISIRVTPPLGNPTTYTVGLGVYSNAVIPEVVPRTRPVNTAESAAFAVGTDGYAYGWATPTDIASDYYGSTISFMNLITTTPPRNPGSPTKLVLPGNPKIREAVPFVSCCTPINYRYIFGALVVDENGKTYTWATDSALTAANGYGYRSSPTTPTEIPALKGVDVVRISVSAGGSRALALASNGAVYEWHTSDGSGTTYTQPTRVGALAGLKIVDIYATNTSYLALTSDGDIYSFYGQRAYLGRSIPGSYYNWEFSPTAGKVNIGESVKAILPIADNQISMVITNSNKIYVWGYFYNPASGSNMTLLQPTLVSIPGNRTPVSAGTVHYNNLSSNAIAASDGTWWSLTGNAQNQLTLFQRSSTPTAIATGLRTFASGSGQAVSLQDGSIWTTNRAIAGTCGPTSTFTRVMSNGQLGPEHKADQVFVSVSGNEITRPNTPTTVTLTGWSACDGGSNISFTADLNNTGNFSSPVVGTPTLDGSRASTTYTFTKSQNGPTYLNFKATTNAGLSGTTSFYTKVVPAPLPGRQIGISINDGARYTNSSNVTLNLVWPDGTTKIYVSNDGGFAPGTVYAYDLTYTIPWVLPPQAVIPLPSIVYARFDNDPTTYYFDDIILDSIAPTLTFVQSK